MIENESMQKESVAAVTLCVVTVVLGAVGSVHASSETKTPASSLGSNDGAAATPSPASNEPRAAAPRTIVFCAPGFPGDTTQAQPTMEAFAKALTASAGAPAGSLGAIYYETAQPGLDHMKRADAALALVPLAFYVEYGKQAGLRPRLQVVGDGGATGTWSLVAKKGAITSPAALAGWEIAGREGYARSFVLGPALGGYGPLPADIKVTANARSLSLLRRAAAGEKLAVLLDAPGADAIKTLPFAADLETVARSKPLPASLICTVGNHMPPAEAEALLKALGRLHERPDAVEVLKTMQVKRFEPVDPAAVPEAAPAGGGSGK
jgi:hypothetical protein